MLTAGEKRQLVASRQDWWHSIDVGDGIVTPGLVNAEYLKALVDRLQLPDRMDGLVYWTSVPMMAILPSNASDAAQMS